MHGTPQPACLPAALLAGRLPILGLSISHGGLLIGARRGAREYCGGTAYAGFGQSCDVRMPCAWGCVVLARVQHGGCFSVGVVRDLRDDRGLNVAHDFHAQRCVGQCAHMGARHHLSAGVAGDGVWSRQPLGVGADHWRDVGFCLCALLAVNRPANAMRSHRMNCFT